MVASFGQVLVTSAGTPVCANANVSDSKRHIGLQSVFMQARPENTGRIYIFYSGSNGATSSNKTTRATCVGFLPAPSDPTKGPFPSWSYTVPNVSVGMVLDNFWLDADNSGEGVIVGGTSS